MKRKQIKANEYEMDKKAFRLECRVKWLQGFSEMYVYTVLYECICVLFVCMYVYMCVCDYGVCVCI